MVDGPDDLDPDENAGPEEGRVLSPEELDISDSEHVTQLDEGRFVVSPDAQGGPPQPPESARSETSGSEHDSSPDSEPEPEPTPAQTGRSDLGGSQSNLEEGTLSLDTVHKWLRSDFEQSKSRYAFDVTASFEGTVSQRRMQSNDVVTVFESLLLWYAQQVDENTPVEEVLGILLMESNVPVEYPPERIHKLVQSRGLDPDDSIAELLTSIREDDGLQL
jgi:hypothetical protein